MESGKCSVRRKEEIRQDTIQVSRDMTKQNKTGSERQVIQVRG